ncbi:MAG: hypothetical protein ACOCRD_04990 [Halorubrum sp.]
MTDGRDDIGEDRRTARERTEAHDAPTETNDAPTTRSMTDTATDGDERIDTATDGGEGPSDGEFDRLTTDRLRGILDRVGLAALVLLALIAGWGFYSQTGTAIRTWLDPAYQPLALAAFNLAVLLVALAGVAHQLARIRSSERGNGSSDRKTGDE